MHVMHMNDYPADPPRDKITAMKEAGVDFVATGLDQHVLVTLDARERAVLFDQIRRRLPVMLQELVGHTEAAVGDAVMARRA